jgi:hypothetical protein
VLTVTGFLVAAYTRVLALVMIGGFAVNGVVVAPMLVYGNLYWPSHWLMLARALDLGFAVLAARSVWLCAERSSSTGDPTPSRPTAAAWSRLGR